MIVQPVSSSNLLTRRTQGGGRGVLSGVSGVKTAVARSAERNRSVARQGIGLRTSLGRSIDLRI